MKDKQLLHDEIAELKNRLVGSVEFRVNPPWPGLPTYIKIITRGNKATVEEFPDRATFDKAVAEFDDVDTYEMKPDPAQTARAMNHVASTISATEWEAVQAEVQSKKHVEEAQYDEISQLVRFLKAMQPKQRRLAIFDIDMLRRAEKSVNNDVSVLNQVTPSSDNDTSCNDSNTKATNKISTNSKYVGKNDEIGVDQAAYQHDYLPPW